MYLHSVNVNNPQPFWDMYEIDKYDGTNVILGLQSLCFD